MSRRAKYLGALATGAAVAAIAPAASAATLSMPSTLTLTAKVAVNVPLTYSCAAISGFFPSFTSGQVSIDQAAGKDLAEGSAQWNPTCDGSLHTTTVAISAGGSGPFGLGAGVPFKNGQAAASASLGDCGPNPINPFGQACDSAATGWQTVKLGS